LALVNLYNSTNEGGWTENYNWLSDKSVFYWKGIEVENGRVTLINLEDNCLTGTIPSSIGNLTALKSLNLSGNNLTGNIPPEIGSLINLEGDIKQDGILTYIYDEALDLSSNNLSCLIPNEIGNLVKIKGLKSDASGEFFINNIPLPGGEFGKFSLMQGDFSLTLLGNEGIITDYLNSKLTQTASLFGAPLKIDNVQFIRRQDTIGVNIGCSVNIPRLSVGCGIIPEGTGIALKNLEITNSGISLGGFNVENLGFMKEGYCLKKLTYDYNSSKDILVGGMDLTLPFFADVGGGFKIEKGNIDSLAWSIEGGTGAMVKVLPIGVGTLGVKGFYGHIAGLAQPVRLGEPDIIDIRMGGIFSDILSDDLYRLTGEGSMVWPKIFEVAGTAQLLKLPLSELPFQLSGGVNMKYDVSNKQASMQFDGKLGILNDNTWLMDATGDITIDHRASPSQFRGNFGGEMTLPKFSNTWPFTWIETFAPFPWTFATTNTVFPDNLNLLHGILYFYSWGNKPWDINYIIDISKNWYESGDISFPADDERQIFVSVDFQQKSAKIENEIFKTFTIPENTDFAVIEIRNQEGAPETLLSRPDGTQYQPSSPENGIMKTISEDGRQHFWSVSEPQGGDWNITLESAGANDTIITYFQEKKKEFSPFFQDSFYRYEKILSL
jgi:hypothetical protein